MAQSDRQPGDGYSPEMDSETHEKTYDGFIEFTTISTLVVACWVLALAMGGVKGAWLTAIFFVVLSGVAGAVGAVSRSVSWKASAAVLGLMTLSFIVM
ncbi:MAG: aa3-type cytochrome c oxidase subunit IV [Salinarimonadaceae bacterium]|nr:MAG: aa3-type cytochrome c oxidase subunit IV [Salinarimonadaceae bacterium]